MRRIPESTAAELEARTFAVLPCPELAKPLRDAYAAWTALFVSSEKYLLPGDVTVPSGYVPLCLPGGCDMKESFYLRPEYPPPVRVAESSRKVVKILSKATVAVAEVPGSTAAELGLTETEKSLAATLRLTSSYLVNVGSPAKLSSWLISLSV